MAEALEKRTIGKPGVKLSDGEKAAILIMRGKQMSIPEIARTLDRDPDTVSKFLKKVLIMAEGAGIDYDFKEDLKIRSIDAVKSGLDHGEDPYKRANLGVNVLKGLGVLHPDGTQVHINNMINNVPPEYKGRYVTLED